MGMIRRFFQRMQLKVAKLIVNEEEQADGVVVIDKDEVNAKSFRESVVNERGEYVRDTTLKESIISKMF